MDSNDNKNLFTKCDKIVSEYKCKTPSIKSLTVSYFYRAILYEHMANEGSGFSYSLHLEG